MFCLAHGLKEVVASRRTAVGLAGVAPGLVPSHGHSALIPDAFGLLGLRAALALSPVRCVGWLAVPFTVSRRSRCQGLRAMLTLASWRPSLNL